MAQQFDIAIIGAGPGGYATALRAAQLGKSVVMVERDATLGGTCLNRGCIPSKALITATRTLDTMRHGTQMGIVTSLEEIDFGQLRDYREHTVATMTQGLRGLVAFRKITVYQGEASLDADRTVHVDPSDDNAHVRRYAEDGGFEDVDEHMEIQATDVVIATGSSPRPLPGTPFSAAVIDSTHALELNTFPHSAAIIGSGAVALEFASMWRSAGCDVTLFIRHGNVLSHSDRRAALALNRELKRLGITIVANAQVTHVDTGENLGAVVHYTTADGGEQTFASELALVAIGRTPNTQAPWFASSGLQVDDDGMIPTDAYGRTNLDAFAQGLVIAESIGGLDPQPVDEHTVPSVIFSTPEFATVGLTLREAQADERYADVHETIFPVMANARMVMSGMGSSFSIVTGALRDGDGTQTVLGVHVVTPDASDLIAEAQQIVANHIPLHEAANAIHPHPTFSEMIGETLLKADGRPLHTR